MSDVKITVKSDKVESMDFSKVGLVSGIEIHQQLEGKKLFCDCPTKIRDDKPDFEVKRRLRAVVGETGVVDAAAAKETAKDKYYVYQGYSDSTCLVEFDEEPPHMLNTGAINLCLQICKFLNCKVVDEIQVMRKTVVDGSNTSGFQRTALVGYDGYIEITGKRVSISSVCLEEDAGQIVERGPNFDIFNLSRLGIPLLEIATGPDLNTPTEVKEAAEKIGMILRSTSEFEKTTVKRGLGTIRQDVNVSVKGGARVEIKGAQDLKIIPLWVENEATRQLKLISLKEKIALGELVVKLKHDAPLIDLNDVLKNTECKFVHEVIKRNDLVLGMRVPKFKGILGMEVSPGRRVGTEISDYGKQAGVGGMIHSDENLDKYRFTKEEIDAVRKKLSVDDGADGEGDAFIMIADNAEKVKKAFSYVIERLNLFSHGVIKEVRKPNEDGTTTYMRPMPGGARMYPETDTMPVIVDLSAIAIGETNEEKAERYFKQGIKDKVVAMQIAKEYSYKFDYTRDQVPGLDANTIASNFISGLSVTSELATTTPIFKAMEKGIIPKNSYLEILQKVVTDKMPVEKAIASKQSMSVADTEVIVDAVIAEFGKELSKMGMLMGKVMAKSGGKADGKIVSEILRKKLI